MKRVQSPVLPWRMLPYGVAIFNFLLALAFCIAFFVQVQGLPAQVPIHWSEMGGFDRWGSPSQLFPLALIPMAVATAALPGSVALIRRDLNGFAYLVNGISLFLTVIMMLVGAFLTRAAL